MLEAPDVERVLAQVTGTAQLVVALLYGSGLRLSEALALRVKDVDLVRRGDGVRGGREQGPSHRASGAACLGHVDVSTTMTYLHVLDVGTGVRSPFDQLATPPSSPDAQCFGVLSALDRPA